MSHLAQRESSGRRPVATSWSRPGLAVRWLTVVALAAAVLVSLAGLRPGAAAQLDVRSAPLQTWRMDVEPLLPPEVEEEVEEETPDSELPPTTTPGGTVPATPGASSGQDGGGDEPAGPAAGGLADTSSELAGTIESSVAGLASSAGAASMAPTETD